MCLLLLPLIAQDSTDELCVWWFVKPGRTEAALPGREQEGRVTDETVSVQDARRGTWPLEPA